MEDTLKHLMKPAFGLAVGALMAFAPAMSQTASAQTTLTLNHYMGFGHPFIQGLLIPWGEQVAEATEGRVVLDIPNGPITNRNEQWNSITGGVADVSIHFDGARAEQLQLMQMVALPFNSAPTAVESSIALWRTYNEFFADAGEFDDVKLLSVWTVVANYAWSKEPITEVSQLDGLKILTSGGLPSRVLTTLGTTPVVAGGL
jgi:TRAP-type C4-dicarboxylate transport system substrate-binding protein